MNKQRDPTPDLSPHCVPKKLLLGEWQIFFRINREMLKIHILKEQGKQWSFHTRKTQNYKRENASTVYSRLCMSGFRGCIWTCHTAYYASKVLFKCDLNSDLHIWERALLPTVRKTARFTYVLFLVSKSTQHTENKSLIWWPDSEDFMGLRNSFASMLV